MATSKLKINKICEWYVRNAGQRPVGSNEEGIEISEFYSTKEVSEKFGVCIQHVFRKGKHHNIPKLSLHGKTFWSKAHCDRVFKKKEPAKWNIT